MSMKNLSREITWKQFFTSCPSEEDITKRFEDLCRQLFIRTYAEEGTTHHSNPNNPGIEIEPISSKETKERISFQAKYFESRIRYKQIQDSIEKAVKYYGDKLDSLYLFCNKSVSIDCPSYKKTKDLLETANINLKLIDNNSILDLVHKYSDLCQYYFNAHEITDEWLEKKNRIAFEQQGKRFNSKFNVDTPHAIKLSLFTHDSKAVKYINEKKLKLQEKISSLKRIVSYKRYALLQLIEQNLKNIADITEENMRDCYCWRETIEKQCRDKLTKLKAEKEALSKRQDELQVKLYAKESRTTETTIEYRVISKDLDEICYILNLLTIIDIAADEKALIDGKFLIVIGDAGMGKSQMLTHETQYLQEKDNRCALLLLAETYGPNEQILIQIEKALGIDYMFHDLLQILETKGELQNKIIPVFIDAVNESHSPQNWNIALLELKHLINDFKYVRIACSLRTEFKPLIIPETWNHELEIEVKGFSELPIEAIKSFYDYYNIPFGLPEPFDNRFINPLFLTLYCETYQQNEETNIQSLYDKYISKVNSNIYKALPILVHLGYDETINLLLDLVNDIIKYFVTNNTKRICERDISNLPFFKTHKFDIPPYLSATDREGFLRSYKDIEGTTYYSFVFDQMNDLFRARYIVKSLNPEKILESYVKKIHYPLNINVDIPLLVCICAFYREKYGEEFIDLLTQLKNSTEENKYICDSFYTEYIKSYLWRNDNCINEKDFFVYIKEYGEYIDAEAVIDVLTGNSLKINNPLNAETLHKSLMGYQLAERDHNWTRFINILADYDDIRLFQLLKSYCEGKPLKISNKGQVKLLLILLGWLLTSSSRKLRDYASKAMIEILKANFELCEPILIKFERVNDPYVYQRLFAIVLGACCRRNDISMETYKSLAEYVYITIFTKEKVFPDILLRDYARLIIERFLYENKDYDGVIEKERTIPPYKSEPIPEIDTDYKKLSFDGGLGQIHWSMRFEGIGSLAGDFGRYIFQSNLRYFNLDDNLAIYNYAMDFIIKHLSYKNQLFSNHDKFCRGNESESKIERIGKKYQWITMHNILARISDSYDINKNNFDYSTTKYEGPWDLRLRDFDPTLCSYSTKNNDLPTFPQIHSFINSAKQEKHSDDHLWLGEKNYYFSNFGKLLILSDDKSVEWVLLSNYLDTGRLNLKEEKYLTQSELLAFFLSEEQEKIFSYNAKQEKDFQSIRELENNPYSDIYAREYPWSPSCKNVIGSLICEPDLDTDEIAINAETGEKEFKKVGKIIHADTEINWDNELDTFGSENYPKYVPHPDLIEYFSLRHHDNDNAYYDSNGNLASFSLKESMQMRIHAIRKDLLDSYLKKTKRKLIWILYAEKSLHSETDGMLVNWRRWTGYFLYTKDGLEQHIYSLPERK